MDRIKTNEMMLRLLRTKHEYADVYTFMFRPESSVVFTAGQYAHVRVPGVSDGQSVREFSFASAPSDAEIWFSVHVRPESSYKMRLAKLLGGDVISVFKIKGDFTYPSEEKRTVVFIAGGVGMTPFRSIIRQRGAEGLSLPVVLIHVASEGYLYEDELKSLPIEQHRIKYLELDATLSETVAKNPKALYYVAGSPYFTVTASTRLESLGVPSEQIRRDDFTGYDADA